MWLSWPHIFVSKLGPFDAKPLYEPILAFISFFLFCSPLNSLLYLHDDVIKWKHFPRYRPFVRGIHQWPVESPHKDQWRGTLMFSLICAWTNGSANNRDVGDLRCHRAHYDITVMFWPGIYTIHPVYCMLQVFYRILLWEMSGMTQIKLTANVWINLSLCRVFNRHPLYKPLKHRGWQRSSAPF